MITLEKAFADTGLYPIIVNGRKLYYSSNGYYYGLEIGKKFIAIEYAESKRDAEKGIFDDVDLFDITEDTDVGSIPSVVPLSFPIVGHLIVELVIPIGFEVKLDDWECDVGRSAAMQMQLWVSLARERKE